VVVLSLMTVWISGSPFWSLTVPQMLTVWEKTDPAKNAAIRNDTAALFILPPFFVMRTFPIQKIRCFWQKKQISQTLGLVKILVGQP
jgi:hypothetical protein